MGSKIKKIRMTEDEFEKQYSPVQNDLCEEDASFDGRMFETYGDEFKYILSLNHETAGRRRIWTIVEENADRYLVSGYHVVNRLGHMVTAVPVPLNTVITIKL
jgi:hypothetical protein